MQTKKQDLKQIFLKEISLKHMVTEMSGRGNVLVGKFSVGEAFGEVSSRGIVHFGKCPSGKFQSGICPWGSVGRRNVQLGKGPYT